MRSLEGTCKHTTRASQTSPCNNSRETSGFKRFTSIFFLIQGTESLRNRINALEDERQILQNELSDIKRETRSMQAAMAERTDPDTPVSSIAAGGSYLSSLRKPPIGAVSGMPFAFPVTWYGINFTMTQIT